MNGRIQQGQPGAFPSTYSYPSSCGPLGCNSEVPPMWSDMHAKLNSTVDRLVKRVAGKQGTICKHDLVIAFESPPRPAGCAPSADARLLYARVCEAWASHGRVRPGQHFLELRAHNCNADAAYVGTVLRSVAHPFAEPYETRCTLSQRRIYSHSFDRPDQDSNGYVLQ